jgi:pimeloyl-ACP methyl ester carboxylesterase
VWYYVKKQLSGRYRIIVWDLPGHGLSDQAADNDYSVQRFANDLRAVLDYAGPKPAVLLGHSLGGMTVQMFCKLFPEELNSRVSRIILFATTYTNPLKTTRWSKVKLALQTPLVEPLLHLTIWLWPAVWALNWLSYLNGSAHRSTARSSFDGTETKEQLDFSAFYTAKAHPAVMAKGMLGMLRYDVTQSLANMSIPALVIDCANDKVILPEALAFIRSQIPIRSSASLAPARHMGNIEQNERFSQLIDIYSDANSAGSLDKKEIVTASNRFSIVPDKAAI